MKLPRFSSKNIRYDTLLHMSIRNLSFKKFRSGLTILGVVIGIGSVFLLLSFGLGLQELVQRQIIGSESIKTIDVSSAHSSVVKLNEASIRRFKDFSSVQDVAKTFSRAGKISYKNAVVDSVVFGADTSFVKLSNLKLVAGKELQPDNTKEVLLNTSLLSSMGIKKPSQAVGQSIQLSIPQITEQDPKFDHTFKVVGIIDSGSGAEVFTSDKTFSLAGFKEYNQAKLVVDQETHIPKVRTQVEALGFDTTSPVDTLNQVNQVFKFFNFILLGFGGIGMIIAIVGMLNTLTISLLERTQEIGLMVSLGARKQDMKKLFITESLVMSMIGGIIGMLGATLLGFVVDAFLNQLAHSRGVAQSFSVFATPLWLVAIILAFVTLVGFAVVYIPARRASKINPIDALRHE